MKKYSIFSILLIALISIVIYLQDNTTTTLSIFGINITLLDAVWVALFLSLFFLFSLIYFGIINIKEYFFKKNLNKDIETLIQNIKNKILYKNETKNTKILNELNTFTKNINGLNILPKKIEKFEFLEDLEKLINGEVIEIEKYKLKEDNPWFIQNVKNRIKKDESFAKEVLKKYKNEELKKEAFKIFAKTAPISEILKFDYEITLDIILSHIDDKDVKFLIQKSKLTPKEEIEVAKAIYQKFDPDSEFEIVENLKYASAYLALKYEHLEKAKEIIEANNLKFFEYFLKLRESGIKADIDEYIKSSI